MVHVIDWFLTVFLGHYLPIATEDKFRCFLDIYFPKVKAMEIVEPTLQLAASRVGLNRPLSAFTTDKLPGAPTSITLANRTIRCAISGHTADGMDAEVYVTASLEDSSPTGDTAMDTKPFHLFVITPADTEAAGTAPRPTTVAWVSPA